MSSDEARTILDRRLALGEISIEEYQRLRHAIADGDTVDTTRGQLTRSGQQSAQTTIDRKLNEQSIAAVDDLLVFRDCITVGTSAIALRDIIRVDGDADAMSVNFIPMLKFSRLLIRSSDGREFDYAEHRTYLGRSRHKQIRHAYSVLRQMTFQSRLNSLATRLVESRRLVLGKSAKGGEEPVVLTVDGSLECAGLNVNLKRANNTGTFGVGTQAKSLSGLSFETRPDQVVASEHPIGWRTWHQDSIVFTPSEEDKDVVRSLLVWLAEPGNSLA